MEKLGGSAENQDLGEYLKRLKHKKLEEELGMAISNFERGTRKKRAK